MNFKVKRVTKNIFAFLCWLAPLTYAEPSSPLPSAPGEKRLEARLLAPCCLNQSLDVHESDLAQQLRKEIHERLLAGQSDVEIERELILRYGDRIRAVPVGDPFKKIASGFLAALGLAGMGLVYLAYSWRKGSSILSSTSSSSSFESELQVPDEYDKQIDEELLRSQIK
ncbi:cytochrome c-type biogenesis protein [Pajaroellobacter abortibovis]|uniref:Cytochrome c-type biogenesis protein n=1 Tax=Pajaroellobacter abortibovis TaxID=1882918 RepID=A0A1L6MYV8_9BACT|nr:cytochrome c-type biogenesis protein CcmH [Pajaroellobacter abortibovis]APS00723.1 hypothetical protein BCY86_08560 [Pajaroellobacter abortibovis]